MTITYEYGTNLYVNSTNRCSANCEFCLRKNGPTVNGADPLWLEREPTAQEILDDLRRRDLRRYKQLVFCGYGEPTYRWDDICRVLDQLPDRPETRLDTNGHGCLICGRDITPEFRGRFDVVSVSLNRSDRAQYDAVVHPALPGAYEAMLDFTCRVAAQVPKVIMTVVDNMPADEIARCRAICEGLGATFRVRAYEG